jgi:transposase
MTPDEIGQIYEQGHDAVVALVTELLAQHQREIAEQTQQIALLTARVQTLEARLAKDSHNSSKPPSSDGLKKPTPQSLVPKSLRQKSGKQPGGQPGHPGSTLRWAEAPDQVIEHRPERCAACGERLTPADTTSVERRQVHDLPPLRVSVTEHRIHACVCPVCQSATRATFPDGVDAPVQYGPQIKALGVYLSCYQLLPFARSCQLLHDLLGVCLSPGTLTTVQKQCAERLAPVEERVQASLRQAAVAHFDETGVRVAGRLHWLHVACTPQMTFYAVHPRRGRAATDAIGLLPAFGGTAVHDGWASYLTYDCSHALCNAHHLRELTFLAEEGGLLWAQGMKRLLQEIKVAIDQAKEQGHAGLSPPVLAAFESRYTHLLQQGQAAHPPAPPTGKPGKRGRVKQSAGYNLVERLRTHRAAVLAFARDFSVPFDNNQAERDVRMMKLRLKISGGFRTGTGAEVFCRLRGYLSTMLKQGHQALAVLTALLNGQTVYPALTT